MLFRVLLFLHFYVPVHVYALHCQAFSNLSPNLPLFYFLQGGKCVCLLQGGTDTDTRIGYDKIQIRGYAKLKKSPTWIRHGYDN